MAAHNAAFYGYNGFLYLVKRNQWFQQYKVEPGKMPPESLQRSAIIELAIGHWLVYPFAVYFVSYPFLRRLVDFGPTLPSFWTALAHFAVLLLSEDTSFYWMHWLMHTRFVYKWVHKKHHEFKYNVGYAAEHDHPIELVMVFFGLCSGLLFVKPHYVVFLVWLFIRVTESVDGHAGYRFPWSPFQLFDSIQGGAQRHEFHHSHNVGSLGSWFTFWDYVMGAE